MWRLNFGDELTEWKGAIRRRRECPRLPRALHPQDRHRQPPHVDFDGEQVRFRWCDYACRYRSKTPRIFERSHAVAVARIESRRPRTSGAPRTAGVARLTIGEHRVES